MPRCIVMLVAVLLVPGFVRAEIYSTPNNVRDPLRRPEPAASDRSLPFVYLEPHAGCYNLSGPISVSLSAVNRSDKPLAIDWATVAESLSLEPLGPGQVTPLRIVPVTVPVEMPVKTLSQYTIDLRRYFKIEGAGVYRLSYVRPLDDGRIHIAGAVQFVLEDHAAIDRTAATLEAGPARDTYVTLLKCNPIFACGTQAKTFGWDAVWGWREQPAMHETQGDKARTTARETWRAGITRLTEQDAPAGHLRALEALVERLLGLSDGFRADPDQHWFDHLHGRAETTLSGEDRERLYLKFLRSRSPLVVSQMLGRLLHMESEASLEEVFRIADGPDRKLAELVLSRLSSSQRSPRIAQYLRRKMCDEDRALALQAAIISCYSGDSAGRPLVVRCLKSADPELRLRAITAVGDANRFRPARVQIVPALLNELRHPTSGEHLVRAIEALEAYPSAEVLQAVTPFAQHANPEVASRAQASLAMIRRDLPKE